MNALEAWLNTLVCTAPFTLDDSREIYTQIKTMLGEQSSVDVCIRRDKVHVCASFNSYTIVRVYDVV